MSVAANLASVRERISRSGRNPAEITIVAVTKGFPADRCLEAIAAGLTALGENRVQEALGKMDEVDRQKPGLRGRELEWHLIGHLQSNKVRHAAGRFALIQSVDTVRLAEQIARFQPGQKVLLEVNIARETQKSGVSPEGAVEVAKVIAGVLDLQGFMGIGPLEGDPAPAFRELKRLHDEAEQRLGAPLPVLSMGMSGDLEAAVAAGSTMLRLGQVLFGPRPA